MSAWNSWDHRDAYVAPEMLEVLDRIEKKQAIDLVYSEEVWRGMGLPKSKKCPDLEQQEAK